MSTAHTGIWKSEAKDLLRGTAAGLIFGIPLLYTMEMWSHGVTYSPARLGVILITLLLLNTIICLFLGFREEYDLIGAFCEAVEAVALAVVISAVVLLLIGEYSFSSSVTEFFGKILTQALVVSLGVSIANAKFPKHKQKEKDDSSEDAPKGNFTPNDLQLREDMKDLGASLAGATLFAFNVAPTEEVILIASRLTSPQILLLLAAEFLFCYMILFASGFWRRTIYKKDSMFQKPLAETLLCTVSSLAVSFGLILLVGHGDQGESITLLVQGAVVLGLPAVVGGAAGRLAL